jgi:hypothetical protein
LKPLPSRKGRPSSESREHETVKRIAIRYCGGCNPTYERVEAIGRLQAAAGGRVIFVRHDEPHVDGFLIVCGCEAACTTQELIPAGVSGFVLQSERDLDRALSYLAGDC